MQRSYVFHLYIDVMSTIKCCCKVNIHSGPHYWASELVLSDLKDHSIFLFKTLLIMWLQTYKTQAAPVAYRTKRVVCHYTCTRKHSKKVSGDTCQIIFPGMMCGKSTWPLPPITGLSSDTKTYSTSPVIGCSSPIVTQQILEPKRPVTIRQIWQVWHEQLIAGQWMF